MAINQYVRDRNGVNDYKKGNRTKDRQYPAAAVNMSKQYKVDLDKYKEMAENRRRAHKYRQEDLYTIYKRIKDHIKEQGAENLQRIEKGLKEIPIVEPALMIAANISEAVWYRMKAGEYDYRLDEYICTHNVDESNVQDYIDGIPYVTDSDDNIILLITYREVIEKSRLLIHKETQQRLAMYGRTGDIFLLKAVHGLREDEQPQTVNNTLVIADTKQAADAIALLENNRADSKQVLNEG